MSKDNYVIREERCPISGTPIEELEDPVLFKHRIYSRESLENWYFSQYSRGQTLRDMFTNKTLPPVKCNKTSFELFLLKIPKTTATQRKTANMGLIIVSLYAGRLLQLLHPKYISESTLISLYYVKTAILCIASITLMMSACRTCYQTFFEKNTARDKKAIGEWLRENSENYDPDIHKEKPADQSDMSASVLASATS